MSGFACTRCGVLFPSRQALGGHRKFLLCTPLTAASDTASAAASATSTSAAPHVADTADDIGTHGSECDLGSAEDDADRQNIQLQNPPAQLSTVQLLQRPTSEYARHRVVPRAVPACERACNVDNTFKLHEVMFFTYD